MIGDGVRHKLPERADDSYKVYCLGRSFLFLDIFRESKKMNILIIIAIGGALGTICRYACSLAAARLFGSGFAWGTMTVNFAGCFLIGLIFSMADQRFFLNHQHRLFLVVGFLGAFTTFSSYALESINFAREGEAFLAIANLLANNIGGLTLAFLGIWLGSKI